MKWPSWPALAFGLIPFIGICFTVDLWDRIHPMVMGLPFNVFWLMLWMVLGPVCMWGAYRFERRAADDDRRHHPPEAPQ
jgi:Protein of unknown function (DUF3311)